MLLPQGSLGDPPGQPLDFLVRQFVCRINRRHPQRLIFGSDASHQFALFRVSADDGMSAIAQIGEGVCFGIEPQRTFVVRSIGAVAGKTLVRKNWTDVAAEVNAAG
jgi:hypothetical protein